MLLDYAFNTKIINRARQVSRAEGLFCEKTFRNSCFLIYRSTFTKSTKKLAL